MTSDWILYGRSIDLFDLILVDRSCYKTNSMSLYTCLLCCIICVKLFMLHNKLATSNLLVASCIIFITKNWSKSFQIPAFNLMFSLYQFKLFSCDIKIEKKISIDWYIEHIFSSFIVFNMNDMIDRSLDVDRSLYTYDQSI